MTDFSGWLKPDQIRPWLTGSDRKELAREDETALFTAAGTDSIECVSAYAHAYRYDSPAARSELRHTVRQFHIGNQIITVHEIAYEAAHAPTSSQEWQETTTQSWRRLYSNPEDAAEWLQAYLAQRMPTHPLAADATTA